MAKSHQQTFWRNHPLQAPPLATRQLGQKKLPVHSLEKREKVIKSRNSTRQKTVSGDTTKASLNATEVLYRAVTNGLAAASPSQGQVGEQQVSLHPVPPRLQRRSQCSRQAACSLVLAALVLQRELQQQDQWTLIRHSPAQHFCASCGMCLLCDTTRQATFSPFPFFFFKFPLEMRWFDRVYARTH